MSNPRTTVSVVKPQLRAVTLAEAFDALLAETAARVDNGVRSAGTLRMQRQHVRYILDRLPGDLPISEVDETVIDQLVTAEGNGRRRRADGSIRAIKSTTMLKRLSTFRRALKIQKRKRAIDRVPEFPEILQDYRPDMKFIPTVAEARKIAAALPPHRALWFWLAVWTGQHSSDVERMTREDLQPVGPDRWMRVRNTKNRRFNGMRIACPAELAMIFGDCWANLEPHATLVEPWAHVSSQLPDVCERLGLPRYTAKSLRHTFFTWMIASVGITKAVMEIGGWSTYEMVVKVYGHALAPQFRDAVTALDRFVVEEARHPSKSAENKSPPALQATAVAKETVMPPQVLQAPGGASGQRPKVKVGERKLSVETGRVERPGTTPQRSDVGAERIELSTNGLRVVCALTLPESIDSTRSPTRRKPMGGKWDPTTG